MLLKQVEMFLRLLGEECKTCFDRRCSTCYSPRAKLLAKEMEVRRLARVAIAERHLTDDEKKIIAYITVRAPAPVRASALPFYNKSREEKQLLLQGLCSKGLLEIHLEPDKNNKLTKFFTIPKKD